ncbi:hypothetical protein NDU88_004641 [Pleurodeles waltl]|uniref:Uncharacterized protein n=1 Tax=Pleurodeles waltl TaxID=8319 RepID=A0AAV7RJS3_PLEWA|nr:hypothetical protein NDU88_004641 [Pleurodeles waltl]
MFWFLGVPRSELCNEEHRGFQSNGRTAGLDGFDIGGPTAVRWGKLIVVLNAKHNGLAAFSLRGPASCNQLFVVPHAQRRR